MTLTITPSASLVPLKEGQCIRRGAKVIVNVIVIVEKHTSRSQGYR